MQDQQNIDQTRHTASGRFREWRTVDGVPGWGSLWRIGLLAAVLVTVVLVAAETACAQHPGHGHGHRGGTLSIGSQWDHGGLGRYNWRVDSGVYQDWSRFAPSATPFGNYAHAWGYYAPHYHPSHHHLHLAFPDPHAVAVPGYPVGGLPYADGWYPDSSGLAVTPPVYIRNRDLAVFVPRTYAAYGSWYDSFYGSVGPLPTYGFASPLWPGFGVVPSVIGLQFSYTDLSMNPYVRSRAAYSVVPAGPALVLPPAAAQAGQPAVPRDPRELPPRMKVTPAPGDLELAPAPDELQPGMRPVPAAPVPQADPAATPLLNEFPAVPRAEAESSTADRIQSLRQQAAGDEAFRRGDLASADVLYGAARQAAPQRRAPWLRTAFVKLARGEFGEAVGYLKAGLLLPEDDTRAWVTAAELYGPDHAARTQAQSPALWDWVAQQPLSADRLLLAGAFQRLRGDDSTGDELLSMASHEGQEQALVNALQTLIAVDRQQRQERFGMTSPRSSETGVPLPGDGAGARRPGDGTPQREDGIFMRGRKTVPLPPQPLDEITSPPVPNPGTTGSQAPLPADSGAVQSSAEVSPQPELAPPATERPEPVDPSPGPLTVP